MKYEAQYFALIRVRKTIEAGSLAEATVRARFDCPRVNNLQDLIDRGEVACRVETIAPEPIVTEED